MLELCTTDFLYPFLTLWMHTPTIFYLKQATFFPARRRKIFNKPSPKNLTGSIYGCVIFLSTFKAFWAFFQQAVSEFLIKLAKGGWLYKVIFILDENQKKGLHRIGKHEPEVPYCCRTPADPPLWPPSWSQRRVREIISEESNRTRIQSSVLNDLKVKEPPEC